MYQVEYKEPVLSVVYVIYIRSKIVAHANSYTICFCNLTMSLRKSIPDDKILVGSATTGIDTYSTEKFTESSSQSAHDVGEKAKIPSVKETVVSSTDEDSVDLTSDEFADIPELVRNVVSFEDDPTLPVITFRSILLSVLFCVVGSFVSQLSYFRTVRLYPACCSPSVAC